MPGSRLAPLSRTGRGLLVPAALLGVAAYVLLDSLGAGPLAAGIYSLVLLTTLTALLVRASSTGSARPAWALLAAGAGVLGLCQLALLWSGGAAPRGAELDLAAFAAHYGLALAGLISYPLLYAGQMTMLKLHVRGVLPSAWLDGLVAGLLLCAGACAFFVPVMQSVHGLDAGAALALALRPLFDVLLTCFAAANWSLVRWRNDPRLAQLTGAFILLTLADTAGVARVTGLLAAGSTLPVGVPVGLPVGLQVDGAVSTAVNTARLLALLLLVRAAAPAPVLQSGQMVRWSSIAGPGAVMLGALALVWLNEVTPLGSLAIAFAVAALVGVGAKLVLLFQEVLALADSRQLALSDELTGLANRRALTQAMLTSLDPVAGSSRRLSEQLSPAPVLSLLLIDLNHFKDVNDRFGHSTGDALLRWTAARLTQVTPPGAVLARLGGDEFAVLLTADAAGHAEAVATAAAAAVASYSTAADTPTLAAPWPQRLPATTAITASIGVATTADGDGVPPPSLSAAHLGRRTAADRSGGLQAAGGAQPEAPQDLTGAVEELLRRADVAMYRAKAAGGGVRTYDPADDRAAHERAQLLEDLRWALEGYSSTAAAGLDPLEGPAPHTASDGEQDPTAQIVVHYQPQIQARTGRAVGVEALVRWRHPRLGLLSPAAFLDLAEEHGLLSALTTCVMHTAARDAARWHADGHPLRLAVNLSTSCLSNPDLLPLLDDVLASSGLSPSLLVMEVTETTLMADPEQALATAHAIRRRGVQLSIDDYGTGFSSLAYLADLPATELKLDRSFTARLTQDPTTAAIVASTVDLAHRLGLRIIAEGVEDTATLAAITDAGCDETQGYLHARPAPAPVFTRWLHQQPSSGAAALMSQASSSPVR